MDIKVLKGAGRSNRKEVLGPPSFSSSANFLVNSELSAGLQGAGENNVRTQLEAFSLSPRLSGLQKRKGRSPEAFRAHLTLSEFLGVLSLASPRDKLFQEP